MPSLSILLLPLKQHISCVHLLILPLSSLIISTFVDFVTIMEMKFRSPKPFSLIAQKNILYASFECTIDPATILVPLSISLSVSIFLKLLRNFHLHLPLLLPTHQLLQTLHLLPPLLLHPLHHNLTAVHLLLQTLAMMKLILILILQFLLNLSFSNSTTQTHLPLLTPHPLSNNFTLFNLCMPQHNQPLHHHLPLLFIILPLPQHHPPLSLQPLSTPSYLPK